MIGVGLYINSALLSRGAAADDGPGAQARGWCRPSSSHGVAKESGESFAPNGAHASDSPNPRALPGLPSAAAPRLRSNEYK
jgi:hypothetical protein